VNTVNPDLAFAHRLADAADAISLRHFATGDTAWRAKSDGSPVSIADEQVERAIRTLILRDRPGEAVLGEEFGATGRSRRRWIIDAIDGTARPALHWADPAPSNDPIRKPSTGTCHGALLVATEHRYRVRALHQPRATPADPQCHELQVLTTAQALGQGKTRPSARLRTGDDRSPLVRAHGCWARP
jgi:inositol monophosphatase family protein